MHRLFFTNEESWLQFDCYRVVVYVVVYDFLGVRERPRRLSELYSYLFTLPWLRQKQGFSNQSGTSILRLQCLVVGIPQRLQALSNWLFSSETEQRGAYYIARVPVGWASYDGNMMPPSSTRCGAGSSHSRRGTSLASPSPHSAPPQRTKGRGEARRVEAFGGGILVS